MRGIWLAVLMTGALLIAPIAALAGEGAKGWYLLEPPIDETSNVDYGVQVQAPLAHWTRIATYGNEVACEAKRHENVMATKDEIVRLSKTDLLRRDVKGVRWQTRVEIFNGTLRDSRLAEASDCVPADDPRLTSGSTR
jgi:hypothetical protein